MMYTIENISKFFMTNKRAAPLGGGSSLLARVEYLSSLPRNEMRTPNRDLHNHG